jgi:hypothetical protein
MAPGIGEEDIAERIQSLRDSGMAMDKIAEKHAPGQSFRRSHPRRRR